MNKILKEITSLLLIIGAVLIFRSSILNWYVIPSGSLLPTLKIGDHVVVNKLSYGLMLPFMETQIISWDHPKRGDVVVFQGPEKTNHLTLIKRVIGVGGDRVSFSNGTLTINGVLAQEVLQTDRSPLNETGSSSNEDNYNLYIESGFSKKPHFIMRLAMDGKTASDTQEWIVPEHKLLLLGDNRDNSEDGRSWGFMDEKNIYGRAFMIAYSVKGESWIPYLRTERTFQEITN